MSEAAHIRTEKAAQRNRERAAAGERAKKAALNDLMLTVHGRRFLWDIIQESNILEQTYVPDSFDRTAFREGQRSRGLALLSDILRWFPASYITMTKENSAVKIEADDPPATQENPDE